MVGVTSHYLKNKEKEKNSGPIKLEVIQAFFLHAERGLVNLDVYSLWDAIKLPAMLFV